MWEPIVCGRLGHRFVWEGGGGGHKYPSILYVCGNKTRLCHATHECYKVEVEAAGGVGHDDEIVVSVEVDAAG